MNDETRLADRERWQRVGTAAAVIVAFFLIDNVWRGLYAVPPYAELARRMSPALGELGLRAPALPALGSWILIR